jgi:hypothetical protein
MPCHPGLAAALLILAALHAPIPASAGTAELRLSLARLIETLDAGLTRGDLRSLRIEINAEIRVQRLGGANTLAELDDMVRALTAADQLWALLLGAAPCQPNAAGSPVADAPGCAAQLAPHLQALGLPPADASRPLNQAGVLQPALLALRRRAERTLRNLN